MFKQIVLISAASLALTACLPNKSTTSEGSDAPTDTDQYQAMAQALQTGGSAHCTITKEDGTGTIEYYAKGEKVRVSGITDETSGDNQYSSMLSDGDYVYTWNETKKEGVKFPQPDPDAVAQAQDQAPNIPNFSDETARDEYVQDGYDVDCQVTGVDDGLFTPPADVAFTDMTKMMEGAQQMMQGLNENPNQVPSAEQQQQLQEQAEQMMQQFGQ